MKPRNSTALRREIYSMLSQRRLSLSKESSFRARPQLFAIPHITCSCPNSSGGLPILCVCSYMIFSTIVCNVGAVRLRDPRKADSVSFENARIIIKDCSDALTQALPRNVAPKKVANGTRKCPHVIPAKSNNGFGMEANRRIPKKPSFFMPL